MKTFSSASLFFLFSFDFSHLLAIIDTEDVKVDFNVVESVKDEKKSDKKSSKK